MKLSKQQLDEIKENYIEIMVDGMDTKTLVAFAMDTLSEYNGKMTENEIKEDMFNYDEELFDELVDNVQFTDENEKYQHMVEIKYDRDL